MSTRIVRSAGSAAFAFAATFGLVAMLAEQPAAASVLTVIAPIEGEAMVVRVPTSGLDLTLPADLERLDSRLRAASRKVCAPLSIGKASTAAKRCRVEAMNSAAPQVASLSMRAQQLAAAGRPSQVATTIAVAAHGN